MIEHGGFLHSPDAQTVGDLGSAIQNADSPQSSNSCE